MISLLLLIYAIVDSNTVLILFILGFNFLALIASRDSASLSRVRYISLRSDARWMMALKNYLLYERNK